MEYRYTAIILEKQEVGETDRLYTLYTKEAGKQRVVAKGVRKATAKLAGGLETMNLATVNVVRGRGTGKIVGACAEEYYGTIRTRFLVYQEVVGILARLARLTETDEADERIFDLLTEWLGLVNICETEEQALFLCQAFLCKLYALLGYALHTATCQATGEKLAKTERYLFDPQQGGFVAAGVPTRSPQAFLVSQEVIVLVRALLGNTLTGILKVRDASKYGAELRRIQEQFFVWSVR